MRPSSARREVSADLEGAAAVAAAERAGEGHGADLLRRGHSFLLLLLRTDGLPHPLRSLSFPCGVLFRAFHPAVWAAVNRFFLVVRTARPMQEG